MAPQSQPVLEIDRSLFAKPKDFEKVRDNLSAVVAEDDHLWLGGDEGTLIDRMTRDPAGNFGAHRRFDLSELLDLPDRGKKVSEIDIEGLDVDDGYLWVIGSHSRKRLKPEDGAADADNFDRISEVTADGNRFTLGRVPLTAAGEPVARVGDRRAARLKGDRKGNLLFDALRRDKLIGPFCGIPSKDNGLDVEGLAVRGGRVFAGLRGPVLRGWAIVLDFDVAASGAGRLKMGPLRKHLLDLDGLGVRELSIRGRDFYVLAGPTMDLDGPVHVFLWKQALKSDGDSFVARKKLVKVIDVPFGHGDDHAEGITLLDPARLMICYDSPAKSRLTVEGQVRADVFEIR